MIKRQLHKWEAFSASSACSCSSLSRFSLFNTFFTKSFRQFMTNFRSVLIAAASSFFCFSSNSSCFARARLSCQISYAAMCMPFLVWPQLWPSPHASCSPVPPSVLSDSSLNSPVAPRSGRLPLCPYSRIKLFSLTSHGDAMYDLRGWNEESHWPYSIPKSL